MRNNRVNPKRSFEPAVPEGGLSLPRYLRMVTALLFLALILFGPWLAEGACVPGTGPNACTANSTRCFDERSVQICNPDTCVWDLILPCNNTEMCETGKCVLNPVFAPLLKGQQPAPQKPKVQEKAPPPAKTPPKPAPVRQAEKKCGPGEILRNGECVKTECRPGAKESRACNPNNCPDGGTQSRICRDTGQWGKWSDCTGCSGSQCPDPTSVSVCTNECTWSSPKSCGPDQSCVNGNCVSAGAPFIEREVLGEDGRLAHLPVVRRSGNPIRTQDDLNAAIAGGELVFFHDRQEVATFQKPASAYERFSTIQAKGTPQGAFLSISTEDCKRIGTSITNQFVKADKVSTDYAALRGRVFRVSYDYIEGCNDCWGGGPCLAVETTEIIGPGQQDSRVSGWEWSLYDYRVVLGTRVGPQEIGFNPATGEVVGLPDARVSYYHGGQP